MHSLGFASGLFPAQWTALRYFARAAPQQRTASALARFQGLAVGPVTRTVRTLVAKGLVKNVAISGRGAAKQLDLTASGETLLTHDPLGLVVGSMEKLPDTEREALAGALESVLSDLHARQDPVDGRTDGGKAQPRQENEPPSTK